MTRTYARYEFGDFALEVGQQRLLRLDSGESIPLAGKAFDTLVHLVEHAGELLDKDALLHAIWPGVVVEENSLSQIVSNLRQLLGEARGENRYIATVARKGYRFVAEVTRRDGLDQPNAAVPSASAPSTPARKRFGPLSVGVAALIPVIAAIAFFFRPTTPQGPAPVAGQTLALLPFKPLLPTDRNESLELGMTESLISSLGKYSPQTI